MANVKSPRSGAAGLSEAAAGGVVRQRSLLTSVSLGALALGFSATPAHAQLAAMRSAAGTVQAPVVVAPTTTQVRPVTMQEALQRAQSLQTRAEALAGYVQAAKSALAAIKNTPTDGISDKGLDPIAPVRAASLFVTASNAATVTANAAPQSASAATDVTGTATWAGALAPVQYTDTSGKVTVRIDQTQERALLSWNRFDVGANTALVFNQKQNGVAQTGWTVVNRVVNPVDPSTILGSITADGTVLVLNSAGVLFGPGSQVNLHSLIASSLDIGNFASSVTSVGQQQYFVASTIKQRNTSYLQNGLLVSGLPGYKGQILSAVLPEGQYAVNAPLPVPATLEGEVNVYRGAKITSGSGGFIILAGPSVTNAGVLTASNGQVSLQGGRLIGATVSSGAASSVDPSVRGLILSSQVAATPTAAPANTLGQGIVVNEGLIDSPRGYISLGSSVFGSITNAGLLRSTTSVSRNGKIALLGGTVTLAGASDPAQASGLVILPDSNGETIPQGTTDSPPNFKTSQIVIGDTVSGYLSADSTGDVSLFPSTFRMGANAFIYAPSADVVIGHDAAKGAFVPISSVAASVTIASGATIDVSGVKDVQLEAARNSLAITPVKRNELRDTPNYRDATTDGSFTLNGSTLYIDPRVSGVRADGVAWVGSPLIDAASAISQIPVTAAELMTTGGAISIDVGPVVASANLDPASVAAIKISKNAIFDISGGWVHYNAGTVLTSQLVTSDGRVVDISKADPNDSFVDIVNGYTAQQPRFGISDTYSNALRQGARYEAAYDEGRDAGSLSITGSNIVFDGVVHGDPFAGANQIAAAIAPTRASTLAGDPRLLQQTARQLPSGGMFRIGSFTGTSSVGLGADIVVYHGTRGSEAVNPAQILLSDTMLSKAGLSGLVLQTSGSVTFAGANEATLQTPGALTLTGASNLQLADGGTLEVDAGRAITFDGNVSIAGGRIAARTYQLSTITAQGIGTVGNPFRTDDDIALSYASQAEAPHPFDLTVNGTLSVAGRWVNDYIGASAPQGSAWIDGGAISLTVAPRAFAGLGDVLASAPLAVDLSGSLAINQGALLDVSSGGYVASDRSLDLSGKGGDVSLINETTYASIIPTVVDAADPGGTVVNGQTVAFTPTAPSDTTAGIVSSAVPAQQTSVVRFAEGSIRGYGFAGGGTFKLISPDIAFGSAAADPAATAIPLDFLAKTGFGTLDITAYHARTVEHLFDNASTGVSTFFDTTRFVVGNGETLDLTQVVLPSVLDADTQLKLAGLATGAHVASVLTPGVPASSYLRKAANLSLHGLIELDVEKGGTIVGAPEATIVTPGLYNAGTITLHGGTIRQEQPLPAVLANTGIGLVDRALGGTGFDAVFGAAEANGRYDPGALNTAGLTNLDGSIQTNNEIFTGAASGREHFLYFLGRLGQDDGIVLEAGSVTDLSGIALLDPTAPYRPDGTQYRFGRIIAGGTIGTASSYRPSTDETQALFANPQYGFATYPDPSSISPTPPPQLGQTVGRLFTARAGSTLDISGTSASFDVATSATQYAPALQWSDAGTLILGAGGNLSGATVNARGGNAHANGGTLVWLDPTIRAADPGNGTGNVAYADKIVDSGFTSLVAYGGLTLDGQFTLKLKKSLLVESAPALDETRTGGNAAVIISATAGTDAKITAPYIHFSSRSGTAGLSGAARTDGIVTFSAGAQGMDFSGGILFDASIARTKLLSDADIRLIGVDDRDDLSLLPVLNGSLISSGDLVFNAQRVYTTTGTGNLQRILEIEAGKATGQKPLPYLLSALGGSTITFQGGNMSARTPLSAGSYLRISAERVVQDGYLAAPLGRLEFGTAADPVRNLLFSDGSVTSVSGAGVNVPYGTTTDLTEYYFTPGSNAPITQLPSGDLRMSANTINVEAGAKVDGRGGGDVFAYEFVSGTGGSRDVLSRFNTDAFSSNGYDAVSGLGYQYADQRQVYAIVPADTAARIAAMDPIYSADYGSSGPADLYGSQAGMAVKLDGGGGIPAGTYVLMPAHYALLPGAYRVVENTGTSAPAQGTAQTLLDGSVVMGGVYATAGTGFEGSQRHSFTIQSQATALQYSAISTTSGTKNAQTTAASAGLEAPRLPLDAARVVLDPINALKVAGTFDLTPKAGGRGSQVDIIGSKITINHTGTRTAGGLILSDATIDNLNANSLLIGGQRFDNADGTTRLGVVASSITVESDARIRIPELVLAVAGRGSTLTIDSGAKLVATGTLADSRSGDYIIPSATSAPLNDPADYSGIGSVLRLANGPQRLVDRQGSVAARNSQRASHLQIGVATLSGDSLLLDTSRSYAIANGARIDARNIALSADQLKIGGTAGISPSLEAKLAAADTVILRSPDAIVFQPGTSHQFNNLTIDAPGLTLRDQTGGADTLTINARNLRFANTTGAAHGCAATGLYACGTTGNTLTVNATSLTFGSGSFGTYAFDGAVHLSATGGAYYTGSGQFLAGNANLTLDTPFLVDRASVIDPSSGSATASDQITPKGNYTIPVTPDYHFTTTGAIALTAPTLAASATAPAVQGLRAPGAHLAFGAADAPVASLAVNGVSISATAGVIDVRANGTITLSGAASLSANGSSRSYGDGETTTTVSAGGGTVNLQSLHGDIALAASSALSVDNGIGNAGTINLIAAQGGVDLQAALNAGATGTRAASLTLDSQTRAFDLDAFASQYATRFGGDLAIRTGTGNLTLGTGHTLRATSVELTADGGLIAIGGTIDTSGIDVTGLSAEAASNARVNGGDIALWGMDGVTLGATALLDSHTTGYRDSDTRQAHGGDITIAIGNTGGAIALANGARIDLGARRTEAALAAGTSGNRLVASTVKDPDTLVDTTVYNFVEADAGGALNLRAPLVGSQGDQVDVRLGAAITGASETRLEAYRSYDLDALANAGLYDGVSRTATGVALNAIETGHNILSDDFVGADGTQSLVHFIRNFTVSAIDGSNLSGIRKRPGVDLISAGSIALDSNWNLGAGVVDQAAAARDGLLTAIPELGLRADGTPYYAVTAGQEGSLLANYTSFLYRVGGSASGEAGVFSLRAAGDLLIRHSITDGFFTFADKSDPAYISYQLGGGNRTYNAALGVSCGNGFDCSAITTYRDVRSGAVTADAGNTLTINLSRILTGFETSTRYVDAPYNPLNNSAGALGSNVDPATGEASGDPLGFAQLFPLLPNGSPIRSSSMRLTAGTGSIASANPGHVDAATGATLAVSGETSYALTSTVGKTALGNGLDLQLRTGSGTGPVFALSDLLDTSDGTNNANALAANSYTTISWGVGQSGASADLRDAAIAYFAGKRATLTRAENPARTVTGVAAGLADIIGFLETIEPDFVAGLKNGAPGYPSVSLTRPAAIDFGSQVATVRTQVRTGDGSISLAAAGNIDLRNGASATYRTEQGTATATRTASSAQVGGTSVYTAGHRIAASAVQATIAGTNAVVTITPDSPYLDIAAGRVDFLPSPKNLSDAAVAMATGGGAITVTAGGSVLGRRDEWSERFLGSGALYNRTHLTTFVETQVGDASQRWRAGTVGQDTEIGVAARYFTSGLGALGGGDITVRAGGDLTDLTVALDSSVTTAATGVGAVKMTYGSGDLTAIVGGALNAGQIDLAHGAGTITVHRGATGYGTQPNATTADQTQYLRLRVADARLALSAQGAVTVAGISALGASRSGNDADKYAAAGFFSPTAGASIVATGDVSYAANRAEQTVPFQIGAGNAGIFGGSVLPPSLELASLTGNLTATNLPLLLYPSSIGELRLFSAGDIRSLVVAMSDSDASLLPGAFSAAQFSLDSITVQGTGNVSARVGLGFGIPGVDVSTSDHLLRLYHNENATHAGDTTPIEIFAGNNISNSLINVPKQARIHAGNDIVNLTFTGQNLLASDITLISAGRDIIGTTAASSTFNLPYIISNNFTLGGPGSLFVQAGRNIGPFINSAVVNSVSYAGGIRTVGNDFNPWLENQGADLTLLFGVGRGIDYASLRETYLNPATATMLDGDLFVQVKDDLGNLHPDRSRPIYAPILATWLRTAAPDAFAAIFGAGSYPDTTAGNAALTTAAYGKMGELYTAFSALDPLRQHTFLLSKLYFNELKQAALPDSPSYQQYIRGYRAVQTLFPSTLGYTDNLAAYTTDPATVNADHPLGVPIRTVVNGQPVKATTVQTGNVDLRLATLETERGGDITIVGPGGSFIAGSVVRTSEQASRRVTRFGVDPTASLVYGQILNSNVEAISSIPIGYEGVLTLRGGNINAFTDGDFRVNQSRVFSQAGGDITLWSSNGDLNAGQGPKSASNFPPITVRFDLDGFSEVDSAGSVAGAGIGAFKRSPSDPDSAVILVAPVGLVDAGDAGVRASGDIFVAAARVANADAFNAGGSISGVPALAPGATVVTPTSAGSAAAAQTSANTAANAGNERRSQISVDILGYADSNNLCDDPSVSDPNCKRH